jgi:hypothetical protein
MKVGYGTKEWVTYILINLSKSKKQKQSEKFPRSRNQPTLYASIVNKESKQRLGSNQGIYRLLQQSWNKKAILHCWDTSTEGSC